MHCVAVQNGRVIESAGDPELVTFLRSAAKPIQALPLARGGEDLQPEELAIASASHLARAEQLEAVRSLLARAEAGEDDLECGPAGDPPSKINHNCSGKHAGMLVACRANGWPIAGYRLPDHPLQEVLLEEVAGAADVSPDQMRTAVDGCGVVTFALPLARMARLLTTLERTPAGTQIADAVRAHPEYIRGPGATDTELMRSIPGAVAKGGAEGLICGSLPGGIGFALKTEDGNQRALPAALSGFLPRIGHPLPAFVSTQLRNSRGELVGDVVLLHDS